MIGIALFDFFLGFLFGALSEWNKKVFFGIAVISAIGSIITISIVGLEEIDKSINLVRTIVGMVSTIFGFFAGSWMYNLIFKEEEPRRKE